jgi:hypothetical protein
VAPTFAIVSSWPFPGELIGSAGCDHQYHPPSAANRTAAAKAARRRRRPRPEPMRPEVLSFSLVGGAMSSAVTIGDSIAGRNACSDRPALALPSSEGLTSPAHGGPRGTGIFGFSVPGTHGETEVGTEVDR